MHVRSYGERGAVALCTDYAHRRKSETVDVMFTPLPSKVSICVEAPTSVQPKHYRSSHLCHSYVAPVANHTRARFRLRSYMDFRSARENLLAFTMAPTPALPSPLADGRRCPPLPARFPSGILPTRRPMVPSSRDRPPPPPKPWPEGYFSSTVQSTSAMVGLSTELTWWFDAHGEIVCVDWVDPAWGIYCRYEPLSPDLWWLEWNEHFPELSQWVLWPWDAGDTINWPGFVSSHVPREGFFTIAVGTWQ